ncbi:MAG: TIGR03943 family protein, partial [Anaerolineae bacterium]|nr:TIGR03943 family protein [Anaerolineae bacterium]
QEHEHEHSHVQDWIKTGLLAGLGAYFVVNIASGNLTNYINVRFAWLSYLAAALFLLLAASNLYRLLREEHNHDHHDHDHGGLSWGMLTIVAVPLVLGTLIPSRPLGAEAIGADINMSAVAGDTMTTLTTNPLDRNILDWVRAFNGGDDLATFNGQEADVIGFVYRDETMPADQFMVARFTISCCVADSIAVGLPVAWGEAVPTDTWVRVLGRFELGEFRGEPKPILHATSVEVIDQPEHPYLYP